MPIVLPLSHHGRLRDKNYSLDPDADREFLSSRLGIFDIDSYFHNRILPGAGHAARRPKSQAPRIGCPQVTWGRALENALKSSKVRAFPMSSIRGTPLPRTGRSGDSWLTPFPKLMMSDG